VPLGPYRQAEAVSTRHLIPLAVAAAAVVFAAAFVIGWNRDTGVHPDPALPSSPPVALETTDVLTRISVPPLRQAAAAPEPASPALPQPPPPVDLPQPGPTPPTPPQTPEPVPVPVDPPPEPQ
jgi:hypothetical protein